MDDDMAKIEYDLISERDFVSLLIELYRNRPILWKIKHPQYLDKALRVHALEEISKELQNYKPDFTIEKVKKKINIIRSNFNKEKHRVEKWRSEGNPDAQPGLWYFNELLFIDDQRKDSKGSPASSRFSYVGVSNPNDTEEEAVEDGDSDQKPHPEENESSQKRVKKYKNISVKRQRVLQDPETEETEEPEQYMTVTTTYYKKPKKREDILAETWAMKLKRMAPDQKIHAEKIINDVLYEGELGNLTKNCVSFASFLESDG